MNQATNFKPSFMDDGETPIIAPSILAADFTRLGMEIKCCEEAGASWIHCDIMDGHFVPNISYGPAIVEAAATSCNCFLDVHLMIEDPGAFIRSFAKAGADLLTVHQEACPHLHRTIQQIKKQGMQAGVALNPATSLHQIVPILPYVNLVLIMSVNPGFGGQSFIEETYQKIHDLRALRQKYDASFLIEVDGGVGPKNITQIAQAGANVFVAGSSIFKSTDIAAQINTLQKKAAANQSYI